MVSKLDVQRKIGYLMTITSKNMDFKLVSPLYMICNTVPTIDGRLSSDAEKL